ncbi:MAG: (E)-4-hydroxy-3-methylbut-2-enyl-diphosphate synthase [Muribaculaceae bacterium]|nr:(E)-4-hydroxy-3-methylbut-2-enyl-diphosphate synthase [Muribaculaceae bacterium]
MHHTYRRRPSSAVRIGTVTIGADHPIAVQSMTNTSTMDTDGSVAQIQRIARAGGDIVRLTAQGVREAKNLEAIHAALRQAGFDTPLVADIHFNPKAALEAALHVEKVRINPGNFVDPGRTFKQLDYTEEEYAAELAKIDTTFGAFLDLCRERGVAVRLGVNHGSLSDRIMSRLGDTPEGMVESAMEFLRVARKRNFSNIVISIKASNVTVMVRTVRLLVEAMDAEDMHFPLHLGVTEAGDGEDARIKSSVGIGSLLADGIGDTIRVSLSEAPEAEIPVARALVDYITGDFARQPYAAIEGLTDLRERTVATPMVLASTHGGRYLPDRRPDGLAAEPGMCVLKAVYPATLTPDEVLIRASVDLGSLLLKGYGDAVCIDSNGVLSPEEEVNLCFGILQACRLRMTRNEYIACPGCGRTLFDLSATLAAVREATQHLRGLKIGVMGCIVNGPGEMADADYGYVGAGVGRVSIYRGKECVVRNIPQDEALPALLALIQG